MAKLRLAFLVLCMSVLAAGASVAQDWSGPTSLGIEIREKGGKPLVGARVLLQYAEVQPFDGPPATITDAQGRVEAIHLAAGRWRIDIQNEGRTAYTVVVRIEPGKKPAITAGPIRDAVAAPLKVQFVKSPKAPGATSAKSQKAKKKQEKRAQRNSRKDRSSSRGRETAQTRRSGPRRAPEPKVEPKVEPKPTPTKAEPKAPVPAKPSATTPEPTEPASSPTASSPTESSPEEVAQAKPRTEAKTKPAVPRAPKAEAAQPPAINAPAIKEPAIKEPATETPATKKPAIKAPTPKPAPPAPKAPARPTPEPKVEAPKTTTPVAKSPPSAPANPKAEPAEAAKRELPKVAPKAPAKPPAKPPAKVEIPQPKAKAPENPAKATEPKAAAQPKEVLPKPSQVKPRTAPIPQPAPKAAAPLPKPQTQVEPTAEAAPEKIPTPEPPPEPSPAPASVEATPSGLDSRQRLEIRSFTEPSCPGCKPGEWALIVEQEVAPASSRKSCPGNTGKLHDTLRDLAEAAGSQLGTHRGPILNLTSAPQRQAIGSFMTAEGNCQAVAAGLPQGTRFAGYGYEVRDASNGGTCQADEDCSIGDAKWIGHPSVVKSGEDTLVYGLFENRSTDKTRTARMILYFKAPKGWRPHR